MPQVRKPEIEARIVAAATDAFAELGYRGASVAHIARRAGLSTGNVYRYFDSKSALFAAVLPDPFVERFQALLDARVTALAALPDLTRLDPAAAQRQAELLTFWVRHRREAIILLDRSDGTPHAGFGAAFVEAMVDRAHVALGARAAGEVPAHLRVVLRGVFDGTRRTLVRLFETYDDEASLRAALATFWTFQLAGLHALVEEVAR